MAEKITTMVLSLKVDLQCFCYYKKIKKLLCKFPQIRDQLFDEEQNRVTITVVCCNPEKIRDKLCCKGGKTIKSIEIVKPKPPVKPVEIEKPKKEPNNPDPNPIKLVVVPYPGTGCCGPCHGGGPCCHGLGRPMPPLPQPCYDGYGYEYGYIYGYGGTRPCWYGNYLSEENASGCSIM